MRDGMCHMACLDLSDLSSRTREDLIVTQHDTRRCPEAGILIYPGLSLLYDAPSPQSVCGAVMVADRAPFANRRLEYGHLMGGMLYSSNLVT